MIHWRTGRVVRLAELREDYQEVLVRLDQSDQSDVDNNADTNDSDNVKAAHYTDIFPPLKEGDRVLLNATGLELKLGSGGLAFVCGVFGERDNSREKNSSRERGGSLKHLDVGLNGTYPGHLMKLRYTPLQRAVLAAEEEDSPHHLLFGPQRSLQGTPVLIGELHSMLPAAVCWIQSSVATPRIAYVMTDGGALPIAFSRNVTLLKNMGWLCGTVTYGHAYGGDLETMNKFSALIAARHALQCDLTIVTMGPGIAGTGTYWGHTAVEVGEIVNAVVSLGGVPIVIPRLSFADSRERHRGLSHHLLAALTRVALRRALLPLPACLDAQQRAWIEGQLRDSGCGQMHDIRWIDDLDVVKMHRAFSRFPQEMMTMGRNPDEDESFFLSVCAAASCALSLRQNENEI